MTNRTSEPIKVFVSYARRDQDLCVELIKHLKILKNQGWIQDWHDGQISAGSEWEKEIETHLNSAQIILLVISSDFLASDYCYHKELKKALERHDHREACVIPVILRPTDWYDAPFGKLQVLPEGALPITKWENHDDAFLSVARGIRQIVEQLRQEQQRKISNSEQKQREQEQQKLKRIKEEQEEQRKLQQIKKEQEEEQRKLQQIKKEQERKQQEWEHKKLQQIREEKKRLQQQAAWQTEKEQLKRQEQNRRVQQPRKEPKNQRHSTYLGSTIQEARRQSEQKGFQQYSRAKAIQKLPWISFLLTLPYYCYWGFSIAADWSTPPPIPIPIPPLWEALASFIVFHSIVSLVMVMVIAFTRNLGWIVSVGLSAVIGMNLFRNVPLGISPYIYRGTVSEFLAWGLILALAWTAHKLLDSFSKLHVLLILIFTHTIFPVLGASLHWLTTLR